jgi:hypothetical protein
MAKNISVMGIYADRATVSDAVKVLQRSGYRPADISVLASDNVGTKDFAHRKRNRAIEVAGCGAAVGLLTGAAAAWLLCTQRLAAPLAAAGPLISSFAGGGAGAAIGWLAGLLTGLRLTQYVAQRYSGRIRRGGILMSVHCDSPEWCERARKALRDTGARGISSAPESEADFGVSDTPTERAPQWAPENDESPAPRPVAIDLRPVTEPDSEELKK